MDHPKLLEIKTFFWKSFLTDMFFDIVNIRDINSHKFELKPSLLPFSRVDDPQFSWLQNIFLQYFEDRFPSTEQRPRNFSKNAKGKMFISQQTYEGFKIIVNSIIEAAQFLLQHEVSYVLTERFCQDPLRTILVINAHLEQGKIIHLYGISDLTIMLSEIRKYFDQ